MTIEELDKESYYNWTEAFAYAKGAINAVTRKTRDFSIDQVTDVIASSEGENDERNWIGIFAADGVFLFLSAGCDYTGWGCRDWGSSEWHEDLTTLKELITSTEDRERLGL
jgi:hypothetical protein